MINGSEESEQCLKASVLGAIHDSCRDLPAVRLRELLQWLLGTVLDLVSWGGASDGGHWVSGWYGSSARLGGVRIEHFDYVPCRVPEWRVAWKEPEDMKVGPEIPENAQWKLFPVD